jgi:hypothetical protein
VKDSVAKLLFKRLGGKIAQSVRNPKREVWIIQKPKLQMQTLAKLKRASPVVARQKNSLKTFRMACELLVSRVGHSPRQLWA